MQPWVWVFPSFQCTGQSTPAQCWTPPDQNPNAQKCLRDRSPHLAHSKPTNRSSATGCHVPGKIPGTFGVEVRVLREKLEDSRAFIHIMDESRAGKSCHFAKYVKSESGAESIAHLMLNVQGLANLGKKRNNSLREKKNTFPPSFFSWHFALFCHGTDAYSVFSPHTGKRTWSQF